VQLLRDAARGLGEVDGQRRADVAARRRPGPPAAEEAFPAAAEERAEDVRQRSERAEVKRILRGKE
jgi:hypothetical protein